MHTIVASVTEHLLGRLEVFSFADLLQWMELNHRSGRLSLTQGRDKRNIDWRDGEIVYVSGSLPRHRLGVHLLRSGALPAATLYDLLARNFTSDMNLTRLILEGGHDTHDGLSLRVEELARRLLFEMFGWHEADFDYDAHFRDQPILRIGLTMRGQALAFQGVKNLDDTERRRPRRKRPEAEIWDSPFEPKETEERFWDLLERAEHAIAPDDARKLSRVFHEFVDRVRAVAERNVSMRPVFEDTAVMLGELLKKGAVDPASVIPIAALDPYLTLDLLILANALSVDRDNAVGTAPDAIERLGARAVTVLIDRLTSTDFHRISESDGAARALRRASVAAAVAAGRYAERYGTTRERAYTLGLLHTVCHAERLPRCGSRRLQDDARRAPFRDLEPASGFRIRHFGRRAGSERGRVPRAHRPRDRPGLRDRRDELRFRRSAPDRRNLRRGQPRFPVPGSASGRSQARRITADRGWPLAAGRRPLAGLLHVDIR